MMTRSLSCSSFSSSPSGTNVSEEGERGKESEEGRRRAQKTCSLECSARLSGVRLSFDTFIFVVALARKNETFFKGGDKNEECFVSDPTFEGAHSL